MTAASRSGARLAVVLEAVAVLLFLLLAGYLRLVHVGENPGWYSDEGTLLDIARHVSAGEARYLAVNQSTLLFARPPLFPWLLAGLFRLGGQDIATLRIFSGGLGVLSVGLLYLLVRCVMGPNGRLLAVLSALMLAIYPQAVLYSRIGFSYNLLAPLFLLAGLSLWRYLELDRRFWLALAALLVGVGAISDLSALTFLPVVLVTASTRRWRDAFWSGLVALVPFGLYSALMLLQAPQAFLFDLHFTLSRLTSLPLLAQLPAALLNYTALLSQDVWFALAVVGLFLLSPVQWRWLALAFFFVPLFSLGRSAGFGSALSFYYLVPLLPWVALGMAAFLQQAVPWAASTIQRAVGRLLLAWGWPASEAAAPWLRARLLALAVSLILFSVLFAPYLIQTFEMVAGLEGKLDAPVAAVLVAPQEARRAAEFVNAHKSPQDVVIASPAVAWLVAGKVADFQLAVAASGTATRHLPATIPEDRFVFDPAYQGARYVVVDRIWRNWAAPNMPEVASLVRVVESWPVVFRAGEIDVYQNPAW